jgi:DNA-binding CsgD family transcriptional regulator
MARALAEQTLVNAERGGFLMMAMEAKLLVGWVRLADRDTAGAADAAYAALGRAAEQRYRLAAIGVLELLATIAATNQDMQEAARLAGAITRGRDERGFRMRLAGIAQQYDDAIAVARKALGDDGFAAAAGEGTRLDLDAATDYVLRSRGERKRPTLGWGSVTPTEAKVIESVVDGLTNPQIATRLVMSRETVKTHLSHVFNKLGVASRAELAAIAATHTAAGQDDSAQRDKP